MNLYNFQNEGAIPKANIVPTLVLKGFGIIYLFCIFVYLFAKPFERIKRTKLCSA